MKAGDMNFFSGQLFVFHSPLKKFVSPANPGDMKHFTEKSLRIYSFPKWFASSFLLFLKYFVSPLSGEFFVSSSTLG